MSNGYWFVTLPDFAHARHVVDIAGGQGTFLLHVLEAYPHLTGTLFELPSVIDQAQPYLLQHVQALRSGGRFISYGFTLENLSRGDFLSGLLRTLPKLAYWSILPNGKRAQWKTLKKLPENYG